MKQDHINYLTMLNNWANCGEKIEKLRKAVDIELDSIIVLPKITAGIVIKLFEGKWKTLPCFSKLAPKETIISNAISAECYNSKGFIGINFSGYFYIDKSGPYTIRLTSNEGSRLYINGKTVIENDGIHQLKDVYIKLNLKRGYYPIELNYFRNGGDFGLIFSCCHAEDRTIKPKLYHASSEE